MHRYVMRLLDGREPSFSYSADGAEMGKLMVAAGLGVAVLPDYSVIGDPLERSGEIAYRPLEEDGTAVLLFSSAAAPPPPTTRSPTCTICSWRKRGGPGRAPVRRHADPLLGSTARRGWARSRWVGAATPAAEYRGEGEPSDSGRPLRRLRRHDAWVRGSAARFGPCSRSSSIAMRRPLMRPTSATTWRAGGSRTSPPSRAPMW